MDEKEQGREDEQRGFGWLRMVGVFFAVALLYALSVGPVWKLCRPQYPTDAVVGFYMPLFVVSREVPPAARFYDWYLHRAWGLPYLGNNSTPVVTDRLSE